MNIGYVVGTPYLNLCTAVVLTDFELTLPLKALLGIHHNSSLRDVESLADYSLIAAIARYRRDCLANNEPIFGLNWFVDGPETVASRPNFVSWRKRYIEKVFDARISATHDLCSSEVMLRDTGFIIARTWSRCLFHWFLSKETLYNPSLSMLNSAHQFHGVTGQTLKRMAAWPPIFDPHATRIEMERSSKRNP